MSIEQLTHQLLPSLKTSEAVSDFMLHQRASRHSMKTIQFYQFTLGRFQSWLDDQGVEAIEQVDPSMLRRFMLCLEDSMKPASVHAVMRSIRSLFKFLQREEVIRACPTDRVRMPKLDHQILPAFSTEEIEKLEAVCSGRSLRLIRNRALIHLLLDSGIRLAECAALKVGDVDPHTGVFIVMGKGRKERAARLGSTALKSYVKYARLRAGEAGEPLWLGRRGPMTEAGIAETLERMGRSAGVHAHPHKFRRTCALMMLRNGCDIFSLQHMLGHADITVLRRYLAQTQADIIRAHQIHSPVDNLGRRKTA